MGQDPCFWITFQMMVRGALLKINFSANACRWLVKRDDFGGEAWDDKFPTPKVVVRPPLHLEDVMSCKSSEKLAYYKRYKKFLTLPPVTDKKQKIFLQNFII